MSIQKDGKTYYTLEETGEYLTQKAREDAINFARNIVEKQKRNNSQMYV